MEMSKELAARQLSAALGRRVAPDEIEWIGDSELGSTSVELKNGAWWNLCGSNSAHGDDLTGDVGPHFFRNGKEIDFGDGMKWVLARMKAAIAKSSLVK
jgi:hypothetical protein